MISTEALAFAAQQVRARIGLAVVLILGLALGAPPLGAAPGEVVATVDGMALTEEDFDEEARGQLLDLQRQLYEARRSATEAAVARRLLALEAKRLGLSVEQLVEAKVTPERPADHPGRPPPAL